MAAITVRSCTRPGLLQRKFQRNRSAPATARQYGLCDSARAIHDIHDIFLHNAPDREPPGAKAAPAESLQIIGDDAEMRHQSWNDTRPHPPIEAEGMEQYQRRFCAATVEQARIVIAQRK